MKQENAPRAVNGRQAPCALENGLRKCKSSIGAAVLMMGIVLCATATPAQATAFNDPASRTQGGPAATGDLVAVEPVVQGGNVSIGSTAQVVVLFRNDSGRPVETGAIQLYPSSTVSASVSINECQQDELPAGATCAIGVYVKGVQSGAWRVELIMRHSGRARLARATMMGQVDETTSSRTDRFISDIEAIPESLDFGDLNTSQPIINGVVLRNSTSQKIDINAIYIEAADRAGYTLRADCSTLDPGQACIAVVTWSPVLKGQASGVLVVEHSGSTRVSRVSLTGNYEPDSSVRAELFPEAVPGRGLLVASQEQINFGSGIETTSAITVSLVNVGDAPLSIQDIRLANSDNGLTIVKKGCGEGVTLNPVEACPLTLNWSPVRQGSILDDVQIIHDGARGIMVLPVRGVSIGAISQDAKAVRLSASTMDGVASMDGMARETTLVRNDAVDPASVLDGFIVTSHSPSRSIISGPGGSRIVFHGEEVVIGGFLWNVNIRSSGVEFRSGDEKVLLLFDRSLSSVNRTSSQSGGGMSAGSGASPSTGSASMSSSPPM